MLHLHIYKSVCIKIHLTFESAPLFDLRVYYRVNLQPKDDESRVPFCHNWFMEEAFVVSDTKYYIHNSQLFQRVFLSRFFFILCVIFRSAKNIIKTRYKLRTRYWTLAVMTRPYLRFFFSFRLFFFVSNIFFSSCLRF